MIYHITTIEDWEQQRHAPIFIEPSLQSEGFIHCSEVAQVAAVANRIFGGRKDLIILSIDESKVQAKIVRENLEGGAELYPHIYGPMDKAAVISVNGFEPGSDGTFSFDPATLS